MALRILISGRVQGVGFRYFTRKQARRLGISGTVENLDDGRVEILASGDEPALDKFLEKIKEGPMLADVKNVDIEKQPQNADIEGFEILR